MQRRKWSSRDKLTIVLEGLKGTVPLGELCAKFQINQSQYYKWRDQLLANGPKVFDYGGVDKNSERLLREIRNLKRIIGDADCRIKKKRVRTVVRRMATSMTNHLQNKPILSRIQILKAEHPFWGYRRIWAYLRYRERLIVNKKRIYRLMKENDLLVGKNTRLKACRSPLRPKPMANRPNHIWGIDMTKVMVTGWGWLYLHVILDWFTKKIVGYNLSLQSKTRQWLEALEKAVSEQFPYGIRDEKPLLLVSDNGSQPTSVGFMAACSVLEIKQIFASYENPKGNADTERVIRTIKEDLVWPNEFATVFELQDALDKWVYDYNTDFPHSSIGHKTPCEFEQIELLKIP